MLLELGRQRQEGANKGSWDFYVITPDGSKLRSNPDINRSGRNIFHYSTFVPEQFFYSPYSQVSNKQTVHLAFRKVFFPNLEYV